MRLLQYFLYFEIFNIQELQITKVCKIENLSLIQDPLGQRIHFTENYDKTGIHSQLRTVHSHAKKEYLH